VLEKIGAEHVYLEVDDAVAAFRASRVAIAPPASPR
jgi:hypothetical protein